MSLSFGVMKLECFGGPWDGRMFGFPFLDDEGPPLPESLSKVVVHCPGGVYRYSTRLDRLTFRRGGKPNVS